VFLGNEVKVRCRSFWGRTN